MSRMTTVTLLLVVEGCAWLASGYSGFRIDWPSQTSQAPFANIQSHQLRVPQLQDSQGSFATYNLHTYMSTEFQHGSLMSSTSTVRLPETLALVTRAGNNSTDDYTIRPCNSLHHKHPCPQHYRRAPRFVISLLNINNSGPFALSERLGRIRDVTPPCHPGSGIVGWVFMGFLALINRHGSRKARLSSLDAFAVQDARTRETFFAIDRFYYRNRKSIPQSIPREPRSSNRLIPPYQEQSRI
jgi:hypothetical protein